MRDLKWIIGAILVAGLCFTADAATNPDPFNVKRAPVISSPAPVVVQAQAAPAPAPAPAAVAPTPASSWLEGLQNWINTALLALIGGLVGKGALWPSKTPVVFAPDLPTEPTTASGLLKTIKDPSLRAKADEAILTVIRSGIVGDGIKAAASVVPGGAVAAQFGEPLLRKLVDDIVSQRLAANQAAP